MTHDPWIVVKIIRYSSKLNCINYFYISLQIKSLTNRKCEVERHLEKNHEEKETLLSVLDETQDRVKVLERHKHEQETQVSET